MLLAVTRRLPTGAWWWKSAILGTLNIGAFFALLFVAAYRLPGGVAGQALSLGRVLCGRPQRRQSASRATTLADQGQ